MLPASFIYHRHGRGFQGCPDTSPAVSYAVLRSLDRVLTVSNRRQAGVICFLQSTKTQRIQTRRLISDGYAADEILYAKNEFEARGRVKMHIFGASPRRCVRMAKIQGAEDEGAGSVLKYMTKPESDSNEADWLL